MGHVSPRGHCARLCHTHPHKPAHQVQPHSHGWAVSEPAFKLRWSAPRVCDSELLYGAPNTFHPSTKRSLLLTPQGIEKRLLRGWSKPTELPGARGMNPQPHSQHTCWDATRFVLGTRHTALEAPLLSSNHICHEEHISLQVKYKSILPFLKKKRRIIKIVQSLKSAYRFTGKTDTDAEASILWPPDGKSQLIGKDPDAGKD